MLATCIYTVSCDEGDLRLAGGDSESEGRLDICYRQRWGTINGDGWSSSDTQVACRQLGFENAGKLKHIIDYRLLKCLPMHYYCHVLVKLLIPIV